MNKLTLLAVDDEPEILEIVAMTFTEHRTLAASNAKEALEILENNRCDVLITDINMPGPSGLTLIDRVAQISPNLPVVVISGRWDASLNGTRNIFRCLAKPFRISDLKEAVLAATQKRPVESPSL